MKALIVDDDLALADVLAFTLRRVGFQVVLAHDGMTALERWEADDPDLIVLDLNLPRLDGISVCRRIRAVADTPIIILSVRGDEDDIVQGLEIGADDYVVKPFSPRTLVARAQAVMRRTGAPPSAGPLTVGELELDPMRREVRIGEATVHLTGLECRLLETLMASPGQVLATDYLLTTVWGPAGASRDMLKQLVRRLRSKIEPDSAHPQLVTSVAGVGYLLELP
ncbi:MAG: response regulator transcription factor [Anaerolineae bacterium]|nr:response regulator transcription factor [Anaerolineae bacterium]